MLRRSTFYYETENEMQRSPWRTTKRSKRRTSPKEHEANRKHVLQNLTYKKKPKKNPTTRNNSSSSSSSSSPSDYGCYVKPGKRWGSFGSFGRRPPYRARSCGSCGVGGEGDRYCSELRKAHVVRWEQSEEFDIRKQTRIALLRAGYGLWKAPRGRIRGVRRNRERAVPTASG